MNLPGALLIPMAVKLFTVDYVDLIATTIESFPIESNVRFHPVFVYAATIHAMLDLPIALEDYMHMFLGVVYRVNTVMRKDFTPDVAQQAYFHGLRILLGEVN